MASFRGISPPKPSVWRAKINKKRNPKRPQCLPKQTKTHAPSNVLKQTRPFFSSSPLCRFFHPGCSYSSDGMRIYASMAALNAAKPAHPAAAACGPAFAPRIPPVIQPAVTLLVRSFFARSPSMQHSVPEYRAPTMPKFFAEDHERAPMSLKPWRSCWRQGRSAIWRPWGVRGES